ncbi:MAG: ribosome assembly RNA-binding protein YhbY [Lachnospiraceae bacterium]|nr:ribosome assembly RNA-binding protein YhbY [Lachnospiraceae bacterium]
MTSKQRAYLKGIASNLEPIVHIGKSSVSPEVISSVEEAINARELIKIAVLKNCADDPKVIAEIIAERTHSQIVHVIGKKIILYKANKDKPQIKLPIF